MEKNKNDFFWPSYVDLMTGLFAISLILFVLTYYKFHKEKTELEMRKTVLEKEAALLNKVKANFKLFEKEKDLFYFNDKYKRIELAFQIKFHTGYSYFRIDTTDIDGDYAQTTTKLNDLARRLKKIIDIFKIQKARDLTMKDISYLMVISGSASNLPQDDEYKSNVLSYNRALFLYKYWKEKLCIDFDSREYHQIIELQISGVGFGGVGRYNDDPYDPKNIKEEVKNQRFIISIAPKIGK